MTDSSHPHTVRRRFSAAAQTYETHAAVQASAAERVLAMCPTRPIPHRICEAGCGTGLLTRNLVRKYPKSDIIAIDIAEEMIRQARHLTPEHPLLQWQVADAATFKDQPPFDLVASNCSLHWVHPIGLLFANLATLLRSGGQLVFSLMLHDTFRELHESRRKIAPHKTPAVRLPRLNDVLAALTGNGFDVSKAQSELHIQHFPSAVAFLRGIHEMGLTGGAVSRAQNPLTRQELERLAVEYDQAYQTSDHDVTATYEVGYIEAIRCGT
jgi:malonyl-CoA O-methyltransferase